jgi:hypothetical protein
MPAGFELALGVLAESGRTASKSSGSAVSYCSYAVGDTERVGSGFVPRGVTPTLFRAALKSAPLGWSSCQVANDPSTQTPAAAPRLVSGLGDQAYEYARARVRWPSTPPATRAPTSQRGTCGGVRPRPAPARLCRSTSTRFSDGSSPSTRNPPKERATRPAALSRGTRAARVSSTRGARPSSLCFAAGNKRRSTKERRCAQRSCPSKWAFRPIRRV